MSTLISLPPELLHRIFSYSDLAACKELRLTCQLFGSIGKDWVFREVSLSTDLDSCKRSEEILSRPELANRVTKFHFNLSWDPNDQAKDVDDGEEEEDEEEDREDMGEEISVIAKRFRNFFKRLGEFPKLQDVALSFHPDCVNDQFHWDDAPQMPEFRLAVMESFLQSVAGLAQLPRGLAIRNMQNINVKDAEAVANLQKVLGAVRSLRLNVACQHDERNGEQDVQYEEAHTFCDQFPSFWLKPTLSHLRHLTLYQSLYFGFYPKFDLSGVHFPHLKSLALGNYTFVHDSQLEWILSHGSTLTELYLDDCPILYEVAIYEPEKTLLDPALFTQHDNLDPEKKWLCYEKRWHHYFRAFQERLPRLRVFRFGHCESWWAEGGTPYEMETTIEPHFGDEAYMTYCDGYGPSQYMYCMIYRWADGERPRKDKQKLMPSEEDKTALVELCAKLGQKTREQLEGSFYR